MINIKRTDFSDGAFILSYNPFISNNDPFNLFYIAIIKHFYFSCNNELDFGC